MVLSADTYAPKYAQIADILRQRIARNYWPKQARLPPNEALAEEFGVSRITIRQAIDILVNEHLLEARQGSGTYVAQTPVQDRWLPVETSLSQLVEMYKDTSPKIINVSEPSNIKPALNASDGTPAERYVHMKRVHYREKQPYCVISIFLDEAVFQKHPTRFRREVVIPILASMRSPKITRARQTLTIGTADLEASKLLEIPLGSPVAEVRRVFNTASDRVIYLGEVTYRGDFIRIDMDLKP
ncbi:GntR family transcriptional regulator [Bradyrhizobium sp. 31Argb]|uniref:GntR family transcriptional regulator n=1 Tax=unclassified Bradyrhizobium TaxID=2631580 RepID=UPI00102E944A|nr:MULTISPECIES: GntR family transcriptional regulator [unclassified Bradyrhizobium]MDI4232594.1 GntR family transcriptional regulator [Bradyrhizobium sp. Arg237L]TAI64800.1 GntR family transcriptional regulator [Bradyrhizobium sp. Leo170]